MILHIHYILYILLTPSSSSSFSLFLCFCFVFPFHQSRYVWKYRPADQEIRVKITDDTHTIQYKTQQQEDLKSIEKCKTHTYTQNTRVTVDMLCDCNFSLFLFSPLIHYSLSTPSGNLIFMKLATVDEINDNTLQQIEQGEH